MRHQLKRNHIEGMIETDVHGEHIFAVRVHDDSMEPLFHPEEIVFVNPDLHSEHDQYVVAIDQDAHEATIRQIKKTGEVLHTLNKNYHDTPSQRDIGLWAESSGCA
jgi:phage repressor protein C with HTH and peptisase S24 domain